MTKNSLRKSQKAHPKTTDKRRRTSSSSGDESSKSDSNGEGDSSSSSSSARSPKHVGDADYRHFDMGVHDDVVVMSRKVFLGHVECYYFV